MQVFILYYIAAMVVISEDYLVMMVIVAMVVMQLVLVLGVMVVVVLVTMVVVVMIVVAMVMVVVIATMLVLVTVYSGGGNSDHASVYPKWLLMVDYLRQYVKQIVQCCSQYVSSPFFTDAYARSLMFFSLSKKKVIVNPVNLPQFDFVEAEKINDTKKSISVLRISISNILFDLIICSSL